MRLDRLIIFTILLGMQIRVFAQTRIFCLDGQTGKPLASFEAVFIFGEDTVRYQSRGAVLNLNLESSSEAILRSTGYADEKRTITPGTIQHIILFPLFTELEGYTCTDLHRRSSALGSTVLNLTRIDAEKIEQLGAVDLKTALGFENNIRMRRDNALGSTGLELMGLGGENVKIMIDGVPVIGRFFNQLDLEQFNMENTESIEIVKGPMSVIYGSNALAGTINIISKQQPRSGISAVANYSSEGQYNLSATMNKVKGNHFYSLSGGRLFFDGWRMDSEQRAFDWIPKEQYNARLNYQFRHKDARVSLKSEWMQASLMSWGTPMLPYEEMAIDLSFRNIRIDNSLSYENKLHKGKIQVMAGNNHFIRTKNTWLNDLVLLEKTPVPGVEQQDTQQFNASLLRIIYGQNIKGAEVLMGFDGNHERGSGGRIQDNTQQQTDAAVFLSAEKKLYKKALTRIGMRYAYNSLFSTPLLYSVQSRIDLGKSTLKLAFGTGYRTPSLKELYLDFVDNNHQVVGNQNLLPESSYSFSSQYQRNFVLKELSTQTSVEVFYNDIQNKIDLFITGLTSANYGNIARFKSTGIEWTQMFKWKRYSLKASAVYTGLWNELPGSSGSFRFSPQFVIQPAWTHSERQWSVQAFYNYFGALSRVYQSTEGRTEVGRQNAYSMLDISASKRLLNKQLSISAGARNLLNVVNIGSTLGGMGGAHGSGNGMVSISPGRTFFIHLKYELFKK